MVPPGIEPGTRRASTDRSTTELENLERTTGFEPAPQGLEGPHATVTTRPLVSRY
jgi:hypothetical protein